MEGLQFKVLQTELPDILKRMLCSFVTGRTAQIKIDKHIGPRFQLQAGVPQGSILSPILFIFYRHDIPSPTTDTEVDVIFVGDISQVIIYEGNDKEEAAIQTGRAIV